jgi:hypothetical protein
MSLVSLSAFHGSRVPLSLWFQAGDLLEASYFELSVGQLARRLAVKYDTAERTRKTLLKVFKRPGWDVRRFTDKPLSIDVGGKFNWRSHIKDAEALFNGLTEDQKTTFAKWVDSGDPSIEHAFWTIVVRWVWESALPIA